MTTWRYVSSFADIKPDTSPDKRDKCVIEIIVCSKNAEDDFKLTKKITTNVPRRSR